MSELEEIIDEMGNGRFADHFHINPPATLDEIAYAEQQLGKTLPNFYKEFLQLANGVYLDHGYMYFFSIYLPDKPVTQVFASTHYEVLTEQLAEDKLASFVRGTDLLAQNHSRLINEDYEQNHIRIGHSIIADLLCQEGNERLITYDHELYHFDDSWTIASRLRDVLERLEQREAQKYQKSWWQRVASFMGIRK